MFRPLLGVYFHVVAARRLRGFDAGATVLHYLCPISPVEPRFPPSGFRVVIGPLSGNIHYPAAFRSRMGRGRRASARLHDLAQRLFGVVFGDKKRADVVLVSGHRRTRESLRLAGVAPERMVDVLDAGVPDALAGLSPARHVGRNADFVAVGRFVDFKGHDLAIRALAMADPDSQLHLFGDGPERAALERLAGTLGVGDRVHFRGWLPNDELARLRDYRGFIFPTLAEANGIVMQEAMMLGLPVVTLRWGGPAMLADDDRALFVEPESPDSVVRGLADAMNRLAGDPALAARLGASARGCAERDFRWETVAQSWAGQYLRAGVDEGRRNG